MAQWGLEALLTGLTGRPVTAAQLREYSAGRARYE